MIRKIIWKKSLKITEKFFEELEKIFKELNINPIYVATYIDNTQKEYKNLEELLQSNFDKQILNLNIKSKEDANLTEYLEVNLFTNCNTVITTYKDVIQILYYVEDENKDAILQNKIMTLLQNTTEFGWQWTKLGITFWFLILFMVVLIITLIILSKNKELYVNNALTMGNLIFWSLGIVVGMWSVLITRKLDRIITTKYTNPVIYYMGYSKEKYDRIKHIKSNIFWTVIVGGTLSLIFGLIGI